MAMMPDTRLEIKMAKKCKQPEPDYLVQKGEIKQSAVKAVLFTPLFQQRVEKKRKGKGSYNRKAKFNKGWEPSLKLAA